MQYLLIYRTYTFFDYIFLTIDIFNTLYGSGTDLTTSFPLNKHLCAYSDLLLSVREKLKSWVEMMSNSFFNVSDLWSSIKSGIKPSNFGIFDQNC